MAKKGQKMATLNVRKGDLVEVITGNDRGKRGKVLKVFPEIGKIIVEGVHFVKKHTRPSKRDPQGGIQERESPIRACNVLIVCPECGKPTRLGYYFLEDGTKARFCKKCGEMIELKG